MAQSYIKYKEYGFWSDDSIIEVWLLLVSKTLIRFKTSGNWINKVIEEWDVQATFGFTGSIDPDLDRVLNSKDKVDCIKQVVQFVLEDLRGHGEIISHEYLNSLNTGGDGFQWTTSIATDRFIKVGNLLVDLLDEKVKTKADSKIDYL